MEKDIYTFFDLFVKHEGSTTFNIEVPRIQRDYVQGRDKSIKVGFCKQILDTLNSSLQEPQDKNRVRLNLNFIYGLKEECAFIPIDGQQRLTTLWAFHLYFGAKAGYKELPVLSYKVRDFSYDFCKAMTENAVSVVKQDKLEIMQQKWFVRSWKKDLTVQAIVSTLDYIHLLVHEKEPDYFNRVWNLLCSDSCPIVFSLMQPKKDEVNNDLYLKMNSRGRRLSEYENLKSWLDKMLIESDYGNMGEWRALIDNEWTSLVWKSRPDGADNIDNEQLRLLYNLMIVFWITRNVESLPNFCNEETIDVVCDLLDLKLDIKKEQTVDVEDKILARMNGEKNYSIPIYALTKLNIVCPAFFEKATAYYNILVEKKEWINGLSTLITDHGDKIFYNIFLRQQHTYVDSVYALGILLYFENNTAIAEDKFAEWMRVVRNIVQNNSIDSIETFKGATRLLLEMSKYSNDIYANLSQIETSAVQSKFANEQVTEEIFKAHLIADRPQDKDLLFDFEDLSFNHGRLFFPFYCMGIDLKKNGIYKSELIEDNELESLYNVFKTHFNSADFSSRIRRMLFAAGNHRFYTYWSSWSYSLEMWKFCAVEDTKELSRTFTRYNKDQTTWMDYLKTVVNLIRNNSNDLDKAMKYAIENYTANIKEGWIRQLIGSDTLIKEHCKAPHWFGVDSNTGKCFLFNGKKRPANEKECFEVPNSDAM